MKYRVRFPVQIETVEGHEMPSTTTVSVVVEAGCVRDATERVENLLKVARNLFLKDYS